MSSDPAGNATQKLNTWEGILSLLGRARVCDSEAERIELLIALLVDLRLLGQDECIPDLRDKKDDIEAIYARIEGETRAILESARDPSDKFIYYAREVLKKLPIRQDAEDMIEKIRAAAEAFEEDRCEDDPMRGFAGDLRKEVHRRLSPRIIGRYLEPYLALVQRGDPEPIMRSGYVALPSRFSSESEDPAFVDLATELLERLNYLWDYETGDLAAVKRHLAQSLGLFERCFLRAEVEGFLELLTPDNLRKKHIVLDLLKRLTSFKFYMKESYRESRIGLYDLLLIDLSIGRMIFLLANDLTNNHFVEVTPRNVRDALAVIRELLNISSVKGLAIGDVERHQRELDELRDSSSYDFVKAKRYLGSISKELQRYLQVDIIDRLSAPLNRALEYYEVPTTRLSAIKTRFFNNFIRRTQIHVLSEFTEKVAAAVDRELERQNADRRLYAAAWLPATPRIQDRASCVATTWGDVDERVMPLLGGKGASIVDMARLGLKVPPAFVLGFPLFSSCGSDGELDAGLVELIFEHVEALERATGRKLGDPERPLLVSVRSGAPTSMPGIMATILNAGFTPAVRAALDGRRGVPLTRAIYRRFLENSLAALALSPRGVLDGDAAGFEAREDEARSDADLERLESALVAALGPRFIDDPREQLIRCIGLVYASSRSRAVRAFSRALASDARTDTAVTVQRMVFGNINENSLSGVVITRNPITGCDELFGEFKRQAQGEEVVMGSAHTESIAKIDPAIASELERCKRLLVDHFRQDLDLEFTVQDGELYFLQARAAQLGAFAHLVADTDFLGRGLIHLAQYRERLDRLESAHACVALPRADFRARRWNPPLTAGVPINGGVVSGTLVLSVERLKEAEARRESVVYFAQSTKPTDFAIMNGAHAIVTIYPGRTSHAAITAMSMNKPCVVGCGDVEIDQEKHFAIFHAADDALLREGERVTVDGNTGAIYRGIAPISEFFLPLSAVTSTVERCATEKEAAAAVQGMIAAELARLERETNLRRLSLDDTGSLEDLYMLVRVDANIDLSDGATARYRIEQIASTLRTLLDRGATPVACSHLGDPGAASDATLSREEIYEAYSLGPVAELLDRALGGGLVFHETSVASSGLLIAKKDLAPGRVNFLENLRFATGEKDNDEFFARSLAELGDGWFVNDAFNVCHRRHASIAGVPKFAEHRLAGPLVAKELAALEALLDGPPAPFIAVFCGEGIAAQFGVMAALLPRVDLLALLPHSPPLAGHHAEALADLGPQATNAMIEALRATYPDKVLVAAPGERREADLERLARHIYRSQTILWSGPSGLSDCMLTSASPLEVHEKALQHAAQCGALTVICSDRERCLPAPLGPRMHLSTGPRAFLQYLERLSLPGITALDPSPR